MPPDAAVGDADRRAFWHGALLYDGDDEYLAGLVPFVTGAVEAGEPVFVAIPAVRLDLLRGALPADHREQVQLLAVEEVGRNPARLIPAWAELLAGAGGGTRPVRGVGEPVWAERTIAEQAECALHESLLERAFADAGGFRLLCPYDASALPPETLDGVRASHRHLHAGGTEFASDRYVDAEPVQLSGPLDDAPAAAHRCVADELELRSVRQWVAALAADAGLVGTRVEDAVLAVSEAVTNSLRYGGGTADVRIWRTPDDLVCEVRDRGFIADPMAGRVRPTPGQVGGRGLWLINQLCDLVQLRAVPDGQALRLHLRI